jgi:hypothetical protein
MESGGTGLICMWCGESIESNEDYTEADDGSGAMHADCKLEKEEE